LGVYFLFLSICHFQNPSTRSKMGKKDAVKNAVIHTKVHLGEAEELGGFGLAVDIKVEGVEDEELIKAGHDACPYSRALTHGAIVNVSKA